MASEEASRQGEHRPQGPPLSRRLGEGEAFPDPLRPLGAEAFEPGEVPPVQGRFKLLQGVYAQALVEEAGGLGAHAGDLHHPEDAPRDLPGEFLVLPHLPRAEELQDLLREVRPHPGKLHEGLLALFGDLLYGGVQVVEGSGRLVVGPDPEGVVPQELAHEPDLLKDPGELLVPHTPTIRVDWTKPLCRGRTGFAKRC